jgi:hypothetical protein
MVSGFKELKVGQDFLARFLGDNARGLLRL